MKAVVKTEEAPGAKFLDIDVPEPGPKDVLIKVKAAAICGTDIHIYEWTPYAQARIKPPMIFTHEDVDFFMRMLTRILSEDYVNPK